MKNLIVSFVKYFKAIYKIYFYICSFAVNILKIFVKPDDKLILFVSFGGKKYDDSPKSIYEKMKDDKRFKDFKFVWAFHNPQLFNVEGAEIIKTDTYKYFKTALKARVWITNSSVERGLKFNGKNTFYFNTWHGTPIKKMGCDISKENESFSIKTAMPIDAINAQSDYEAEIFSRVFGVPIEKFLKVGLPRNDNLALYSEEYRDKLFSKIGISKTKKVILYAPTFREYERDSMKNCVLAPPINLQKWKNELSDKYVILFRAHYEVSKIMNIENDDFIKNVSQHPSLEDLMIISDILISDYSSIFFDYSIMDKPMIHFTYDYNKYVEKRGMYFDIRDYILGADNEDDLISLLNSFDYDKMTNNTIAFRNKYVNYYGNATEKSIDCIAEKIGV